MPNLQNSGDVKSPSLASGSKAPAPTFTWVPLYRELADQLAGWDSRQKALIEFLEGLRQKNCIITSLTDQDPPGNKFPLQELDPFTFFGTFNRGLTDTNRRLILSEMTQHFGLKSALPEDFNGIPILNNQSSWFIAYHFHRDPKDVSRLWNVFQLALKDDPLNSATFWTAFDDALKVRQTNRNLTMGLFWIRPETFISLDQTNRAHLHITMPSSGLTSAFYQSVLETAKKTGKSFLDISYEAWVHSHDGANTKDPPLNPVPPTHPSVETTPTSKYWAISLGEGGRLWDQCRKEGVAAIGWNYLGDLRQYKDKEKITEAIQKHEGDGTWPTNDSLACFQFCHEMSVGDIVFAKRGRSTLLGCGKIKSDYKHQPERPEYHNIRDVDWVYQQNQEIPADAKLQVKTLTEVTDHKDFLAFALPFLAEVPVSPPPTPKPPTVQYTMDMALKDVFINDADFRSFLVSFSRKQNAIIQGPPGVGKTFIARRLAYLLIGSEAAERVTMVQFHQSYSYEDFIQGWRPTASGGFELRNGTFYDFCTNAKNDPDSKHVFVIDEINRGNLSKIFGELFMLIEADKRGPDWAMPLTYAPTESFFVPANLYLLGLMNTADRSLAMVDYALRRRFTFLDLRPAFDKPEFQSYLASKGVETDLINRIVTRMTDLNLRIRKEKVRLGDGFEIGHSFFCPQETDDRLDLTWYRSVIKTEIAPLVREYWFDDLDTANDVIGSLLQ